MQLLISRMNTMFGLQKLTLPSGFLGFFLLSLAAVVWNPLIAVRFLGSGLRVKYSPGPGPKFLGGS